MKKVAKCSLPVDSEIKPFDPSTGIQERSILDQADAVKKQWQQVVEMLEQRLNQCNILIKELQTFEEQHRDNLAFIDQGEELINEYQLDGKYSLSVQMSKCQVIIYSYSYVCIYYLSI